MSIYCIYVIKNYELLELTMPKLKRVSVFIDDMKLMEYEMPKKFMKILIKSLNLRDNRIWSATFTKATGKDPIYWFNGIRR